MKLNKMKKKMYNIIKMHDCVLNTSGEHNIEKDNIKKCSFIYFLFIKLFDL